MSVASELRPTLVALLARHTSGEPGEIARRIMDIGEPNPVRVIFYILNKRYSEIVHYREPRKYTAMVKALFKVPTDTQGHPSEQKQPANHSVSQKASVLTPVHCPMVDGGSDADECDTVNHGAIINIVHPAKVDPEAALSDRTSPRNTKTETSRERIKPVPSKGGAHKHCARCGEGDHSTSRCSILREMTSAERADWIRSRKACKKCADVHSGNCDLPKYPCFCCKGDHLTLFHDIGNSHPRDSKREVNASLLDLEEAEVKPARDA